MIVRLKGRVVNLDHLSLAEDADSPHPGGMRIYLIGQIERDLDAADADRLRRRFIEIDPEPLPGEGPIERDISATAVIRDGRDEPARRQRRGGS